MRSQVGMRLPGMSYPLSDVPQWCGMSWGDHADGLAGCWGINDGQVAKGGERYCQGCEFKRPAR